MAERTNENGSGHLSTSVFRVVTDMTFEELVAELERVASSMDNGSIGIEAATELYARAAELHSAARDRLAEVTKRVEELRSSAPSPNEL